MPGNDHLIDFSARAWPAGWEVSGNAFGGGPTQTMNWTGMGFDTDTLDVWNMIAGFDGSRLLHSGLRPAEDYRCHADCRSMHPGCAIPEPVEEQTGRLLSPPFRIDKRFINLRIGGSYSPLHACVNLHVDEQVVRSSTGANTGYLRWQTWDVGKWRGRSARIEILDADPRGHISVSSIAASDTPGTEPQSIFFQPQKLDRMQDVWLVYHEDTYYLYHEDTYYLYWLVGTQYRQRFGVRAGRPPRLYGIALCTSRDGIRWNEAGIVIKLARDAQWMGSGAVWKRSDFDESGVFVMNFSEWRGPTGDLGQQTIFFAESTDLVHWTRLSDDLEFVPDERWYFRNKGNGSRWDCIFPVQRDSGGYYGYFTGTPKPHGTSARALAESADGVHWRALPPVAAPLPGEVGGCAKIGDRYYMIATGLCMVADNPTGPFETQAKNGRPLSPDSSGYSPSESHGRLMHGAGFPRFFVSPFGVLICMHLSDQDATDHEKQRSQNRFGLLLSTEVDAEGTLRAKWFANNDQLEATPVRNLSASASGSPRWLHGIDALAEGSIIEGEVTLATGAPANQPPALLILYGPDVGAGSGGLALRVGLQVAGRCALDIVARVDGTVVQPLYAVDHELELAGTVQFRLVVQSRIVSLYLDDYYISLLRVAEPVARVGLEGGGFPADRVRAWKAPIYYHGD